MNNVKNYLLMKGGDIIILFLFIVGLTAFHAPTWAILGLGFICYLVMDGQTDSKMERLVKKMVEEKKQ